MRICCKSCGCHPQATCICVPSSAVIRMTAQQAVDKSPSRMQTPHGIRVPLVCPQFQQEQGVPNYPLKNMFYRARKTCEVHILKIFSMLPVPQKH